MEHIRLSEMLAVSTQRSCPGHLGITTRVARLEQEVEETNERAEEYITQDTLHEKEDSILLGVRRLLQNYTPFPSLSDGFNAAAIASCKAFREGARQYGTAAGAFYKKWGAPNLKEHQVEDRRYVQSAVKLAEERIAELRGMEQGK